jgi:hypothetical protein
VTYGFGVLRTAMDLRLKRWGLANPAFLADVPYERLPADSSDLRSLSVQNSFVFYRSEAL